MSVKFLRPSIPSLNSYALDDILSSDLETREPEYDVPWPEFTHSGSISLGGTPRSTEVSPDCLLVGTYPSIYRHISSRHMGQVRPGGTITEGPVHTFDKGPLPACLPSETVTQI